MLIRVITTLLFILPGYVFADVIEYEATGVISEAVSGGNGTAADGLIAGGETFIIRFTLDTDEILGAYWNNLPQGESADYWQSYPISIEFSGGLLVDATPVPGAWWGDNLQARQIDYEAYSPGQPISRYHALLSNPDGMDFVFDPAISVDDISLHLSFRETASPYEFTSTDLTALPALSNFDETVFYLFFDDYDDPGGPPSGGTYFVGYLDSLSSDKTPVGEGVLVRPSIVDEDGVPIIDAPVISLTFDLVSTSGDTSVVITEDGPQPPAGFRLLGIDDGTTYIDIKTTATFVGDVEICINYSEFTPAVDPDKLSLAHIVDGEWINISLSKDLVNQVLCGSTTSFSHFAIVQVADPFFLLSELLTAVNDLDATEEVKLSLISKLEKVERLLEGGGTAGAASDLVKKFISKVQKYRDKHISIPEADELVRRVTELNNVLLF
jgi:hypothetical protein